VLANGWKPTKDDFHRVKLLSQGAYGCVYLARHRETLEYFAMKSLRKKDMANRNLVNQVLNERDILQFAQNPFVIQFICSFTTKVCAV
jgi:serine/threonine protein kinase